MSVYVILPLNTLLSTMPVRVSHPAMKPNVTTYAHQGVLLPLKVRLCHTTLLYWEKTTVKMLKRQSLHKFLQWFKVMLVIILPCSCSWSKIAMNSIKRSKE